MSNSKMIEAFDNGCQDKRWQSCNIMIVNGVLYSYGRHFPLAIENRCCYILNVDSTTVTTTKHQSACRSMLEPYYEIAFSALSNIGDPVTVAQNLNVIDFSESQYRDVQRINPKTGEKETYQEHLAGSLLFEYEGKYYLSSTDTGAKNWGRGYFLVELPEPCKTIDEAYNALKPKDVDSEYIRQGEFFFVPVEYKLPEYSKRVNLSKVFGNEGNPHIARDYATALDGDWHFVRGTVRHPEHKMAKLGETWHRVYINRAVNSYNATGNVD